MDAGMRHKTLGSEMKNSSLLIAVAIASVSAILPWPSEPKYPEDDAKMAR